VESHWWTRATSKGIADMPSRQRGPRTRRAVQPLGPRATSRMSRVRTQVRYGLPLRREREGTARSIYLPSNEGTTGPLQDGSPTGSPRRRFVLGRHAETGVSIL
jgi:hypothetical protein